MSDTIMLLNEISYNQQNTFINTSYKSFLQNALYGWLFENLGLREIEEKYLGANFRGWFTKNVLNQMGIATNKGTINKGLYQGKDVVEVANQLIHSNNKMMRNIGKVLLEDE